LTAKDADNLSRMSLQHVHDSMYINDNRNKDCRDIFIDIFIHNVIIYILVISVDCNIVNCVTVLWMLIAMTIHQKHTGGLVKLHLAIV
jgi:hypothetical protein